MKKIDLRKVQRVVLVEKLLSSLSSSRALRVANMVAASHAYRMQCAYITDYYRGFANALKEDPVLANKYEMFFRW